MLIDFDASVRFEGDVNYVGFKYSSGYVPPEMIYVTEPEGGNSRTAVVRAIPQQVALEDRKLPYDFLLASPSYDMWSVGVVLYQLFSDLPLFLCDSQDHVDNKNLLCIASWSDNDKMTALSKINEPQAKNFLSLLLQKDPTKRPLPDKLLQHPFISGKSSVRKPGEVAEYDVFISYRVNSDVHNAEILYEKLTALGLTVWWDKKCLEPGKPWEEGFCNGLAKSRSFVPLMSRESINSTTAASRNFSYLEETSPVDNVFLEYRLALELRDMGLLEHIYPVMIGDYDENYLSYGNYFTNQCLPKLHKNVIVASVERKVIEHLDRQGLGAPMCTSIGVLSVINSLLKNHGGFVEGPEEMAFNNVVDSIVIMVEKNKNSEKKYRRFNSVSHSSLPDSNNSSTNSLKAVDHRTSFGTDNKRKKMTRFLSIR